MRSKINCNEHFFEVKIIFLTYILSLPTVKNNCDVGYFCKKEKKPAFWLIE